MNKFIRIPAPLTAVIAIVLFGACSSGSGGDGGTSFDRAAMLDNYGNNVIIPAYSILQNEMDLLQSEVETFSGNPDEANLTSLQDQLKSARLSWQDVSMFQFGPAESVTLRSALNTYPADSVKIESNIESGDYALGTLDNRDAAGFPALGYLLHGIAETNQEIVSKYTDGANASARITYLQENVAYLQENVDETANEWNQNYIDTYLSEDNAGTDVGSSLGMMINSMVLHYERYLRDGKIGIPAGVRSAGVPRPAATEAFYGGYSVELAIANLEAIKRLYLGTGLESNDGLGLEENLQALDAQDLSDEIITEIDEALAALEGLNDPLSEQVESDNEPVLTAFQDLQDIVVLLKADMTSVLGITITYQDNDGD